ncbi:unnamed protein product [Rotaria sp. Silwood1]|nr:unnamed protein product [Rotaria sp. Silwood1]
MGSRSSKRQPPQSSITTSEDSSDNEVNSFTCDEIHRIPIDQSDTIGSLYDARQDLLLKVSALNIRSAVTTLEKPETYPEINIGKLKGKKLSDVIGIDKELYLSIYLKIVDSDGISSSIKHPFTINKYTRFLSYYYPTKQNQLNNKHTIVKSKNIEKLIANTNITHVVTTIKYGIHVMIVLQLSPNDQSDLDQLLEKIKEQLTENTFDISTTEQNRFTHTKVFSNIPDIARLKKLADVCQKLTDIKSDFSQHRPIEYTLQPIRHFCPSYPIEKARFVPLNQQYMDQIEPYLHQLSLRRRKWNISLNIEEKQLLEKYLMQAYEEFRQQNSTVAELYHVRVEQKKNLILQIRNGDIKQDPLSKPLIDTEDETLLKAISDVIKLCNTFREKAQLIDNLMKQDIEYLNVKEGLTKDDNNLKRIKTQIVHDNEKKFIYCFDEKLEKLNSSNWNAFYTQLINERKNNSKLELVYADFSYCSCQLSQMEILPSKEIDQLRKASRAESTLNSTPSSSKTKHPNESNLSRNNIINVLLLGESGVGKSTFVNAIVNYFNFDTLQKARSSEPIVLMPVSFLMTVGDKFEEKIIRFGDEDPNENHHHPGQSVTQHCRSYVFTIDSRTKVRLIDTPGMGDTRGLDQDDLNMEHIISFITNLSHLNAICILLKPNESKLNVVLHSYFNRLLSFLGESVHHNIIFCFTNTRGTFFAPGNTGPLLKSMLASCSFKDILFKKTNTFCFDNESFRYLVACKKNIEFDDYQKEEYQHSWVTSVNETNRLMQYVCKELKPSLQKDWTSIEHAQFQINRMSRPLLETIKNTIRNMILLNKSSSKSLIRLCPSSVNTNSYICMECKRSIIKYDDIWILRDELHILSDRCDRCQCDLSRHSKANYILKYELYEKKQKPSLDEIKTNLDQLKHIIIQFAYFYKYLVHMTKENDPLLSVLSRMINEEKTICSYKENHILNANLYDELKSFRNEYEKVWPVKMSNQKSLSLMNVYSLIKNAREMREINEQLSMMKQTEDIYMNEHEKQVSKGSVNNGIDKIHKKH